jgi:hypothetical protein
LTANPEFELVWQTDQLIKHDDNTLTINTVTTTNFVAGNAIMNYCKNFLGFEKNVDWPQRLNVVERPDGCNSPGTVQTQTPKDNEMWNGETYVIFSRTDKSLADTAGERNISSNYWVDYQSSCELDGGCDN